MSEETIIPEVLDPDGASPEGERPTGSREDWPPRGPMAGWPDPVRRDHSPLERILSPLKALLVGTLILSGIALAVMVGGILFLAFMVIFFVSFLVSGLFGRRNTSSGSIVVERYGPSGQHEARYTRIERSGGGQGPGHGSNPN